MMHACQEGDEHVVEALLKGGATVDIQDEVIPVINHLTVGPPPHTHIQSHKSFPYENKRM